MNKRRKKAQAGFTLLEILVVLMIMGFLLAMVAPKLLGVFQDSEDTICDTNIKDSKKYVSLFEIQYSKLPDKMMAPAYLDTAGAWYGPTEENVAADGNEVFTAAILERLRLAKHVLNQNEIDEIVNDLGIREVVVLNNPDDIQAVAKNDIYGAALPATGTTEDSQFKLVTLGSIATATLPMIGGGDAVGGGAGWANNTDWDAVGENIADPEWAYRLILGIGPDSELMHRIIAAEGTCPSFERVAADDTMWGWYVVVLPRLQATVDSLTAVPGTVLENVTCWADSADVTSQRKTFDLTSVDEEYKRASFDIFCPEGHRYPEVVEFWGIESIN
ncbi:MAG: type II secretion system protein [Candidatus Omnitrophica bacterium]|nr:type II secretion system protein [Candidatus Omnitrophota bacterium]